ncbi:unnamed protein product [Lathyrus sativus]|nr:unnamed protein product [Lathyrus sativus]
MSSSAPSRIQLTTISRLRSYFLKKLPEPLRRAVADCLSSSLSSAVEPSRILRDYLAAPATMDLAYSAILEYTMAERVRSPAVVTRCVAILKRYLLRYKPSEETLLQIDRFCLTIIAECDNNLNRPWSISLNQQSCASTTLKNTSPLSISKFASEAIVKSLSYVRSLVAQHIPKRPFEPSTFSRPSSASGQSLPTLSSLLDKSFSSQLSPARIQETVEKDSITSSTSKLSNIENFDEKDKLVFIAHDVLQWRWLEEQQSPSMLAEDDNAVSLQDKRSHNFLEVGAAALLVGGIESKMKGQPRKYFGTDDMPYLNQLLQSSPVTSITNSSSARPHLRAIDAYKHIKTGSRQVWEDFPVSTFRPRARQLFQYRCYSEQQPLRLNPAELCEVIAVVCSEISTPNTNFSTMSTSLTNNSGKPSMDVAVSVLIKLIIDMYVLDSRIATPLTLSLLEEMLSSSKTACRARAFDLILNLGVHAHLLEPMIADDTSTIEEDYSQESLFDIQLMAQGSRKGNISSKLDNFSAMDKLESWILNILYEILLLLVQVIKALIQTSRKNSWAELVHCKLISILANMFYEVSDEAIEPVPSTPKFLVNQLDMIGGVQFLFREYALVNSKEERKNLYSILFDYVLHQINETRVATRVNEYSDDEIRPLATLLAQTNAADAFYISVKLGVEGIGGLLRRSIASPLSKYPNSERLNTLLEKVTEKFDEMISSFTHLEGEFSGMIQITKTHRSPENMEGVALRNDIGLQAKHSWSTLHSLLHSERLSYRQNGCIWLGDLLIDEISRERDGTIWSNIKSFQENICQAGKHDSSTASDAPLPISLMCGLLKSKHNYIRWGFLFVLERLLMRCKFLLDEYEMQSMSSDLGHRKRDWHLDKAHAVIDIMSSALLFQINEKDCTNKYETDCTNILKMCDILFYQLCLRVPPAMARPYGDDVQHGNNLNCSSLNKCDGDRNIHKGNTLHEDKPNEEEAGKRSSYPNNYHMNYETAAMAALLLQGQAIVPMQLIARVPAALLYWPLIQLDGAATDDIALGIAVGSKGIGNLPGATSDIRATLLLLLVGKCTSDPVAFKEVGGERFFRHLLEDTDSRVAYYSSAFLLKRMMTEKPDKYQHMLQNLVVKAQQSNNEKLLENPYLQLRGILQLANDLGYDL